MLNIHQERPLDLICMGRVAVDLYAEQIHRSLADAQTFRKYLGGCAGNIAVGAARLGLRSAMFSCVGKDEMGKFLCETLQQEQVDTTLVYETDEHLTGLVLLGIDPPHHFPLMFYRKDCADMQLTPAHVKKEVIAQAKALLFTGTGLSTPNMQAATLAAIQTAREVETLIIMDLDYRPVLWNLTSAGNGETRFIENTTVTKTYQTFLPYCDLIVGTEEELCIASGAKTITDAITILQSLTKSAIVVKAGAQGCQIYLPGNPTPQLSKPFPVEILNVLGAGDAFMAGLLRGLLRNENWDTATTYANACGALVVTRHGCAPAMPFWNELLYFINHFDSIRNIWLDAKLVALHEPSSISAITPPSTVISSATFSDGLTSIVNKQQHAGDMNFASLKLRLGECFSATSPFEAAYLLMTGKVRFSFADQEVYAERFGYFEQDPILLHCPANECVMIEALSDAEILIMETENSASFPATLFTSANLLESEHRGQHLLENTSYRIVRTIFDKRNRPESNLVIGEIITFQGHWSSYPPHYHPQAEIYHYRFSEPQGFAFGENGDDVLRLKHNDTYLITDGQEHAHCTAPGYALYTLWFIRHLPNQAYHVPTFRSEHNWTRDPSANLRAWKIRQ